MQRVMVKERPRDDLASDLLWGAKAISDYIGLPLHKTNYLIRSDMLPIKRLGDRILASKSELQEHFARIGK